MAARHNFRWVNITYIWTIRIKIYVDLQNYCAILLHIFVFFLMTNRNAKTSISAISTWPFKPSRCIKASLYIPEIIPNFPTTSGFKMKISMKLIYQDMAIFIACSPTSNHLHSLQVENCDSNSRLVVGEDDNGKFRLEKVKPYNLKTV